MKFIVFDFRYQRNNIELDTHDDTQYSKLKVNCVCTCGYNSVGGNAHNLVELCSSINKQQGVS